MPDFYILEAKMLHLCRYVYTLGEEGNEELNALF
jgi:hypothetical protein